MWAPLLSFAALAAADPVPSVSPSGAPALPGNVLVIVIDDVGCDLVGTYDQYFRSAGRAPGTPASTPAIDTLLAARGVTFANAYGAPVCSPARARILTGRYGFRNGIGSVLKENENLPFRNPGLSEDQVLLPEALHLAPTPYTCVALGKWHVADIYQLLDNPTHPLGFPPGRWFDGYAGALFNLTQAVPGSPQNIYYSWTKRYASYLEPGVNPCPTGAPPCDVPVVVPPVTNYATVDTTEDALRMVQVLPEPWFLYVAYNAAHAPGHAIPQGLPQAACSNYVPSVSPCNPGAPSTPASRIRCVVAELDNQIGRLLCNVDESDTTVILIGDNGTDRDAALPPVLPENTKGTLFEDGVRIPFIVRSPLVAPSLVGTVTSSLASTTDVFATAAAIAGISNSSGLVPEDSISLMPVLQITPGARRASAYAESFLPNFRPDPVTGLPPPSWVGSRHNQVIRDRRFKLIRRWERDHLTLAITMTEEFYDLLQGGPPDTSTNPPTPTRDWNEQNDLLVTGVSPQSAAGKSLARLRQRLDVLYPSLLR
jgi:arylsulfatase A-like enzyme